MAKRKIIYNPYLTIAENAYNNKVTESAIRRYIRINKIDRKGDNALILRSSIKELRKKNPDISIAEICRTLNLSKNTVKKYLDADIKGSEIDTVKVSMFDQSKRIFIISSVSNNQDLILSQILRLYIPSFRFECDLTYSIGNFYKKIPQPQLKYDKYPKADDIKPLEDFYNIDNCSVHSIVIDLPFIVKPNAWKSKSKMAERFSCFPSVKELYKANDEMLQLANAKLAKNGILVMKTMDFNYGGKQHWVGNYVQNKAVEVGFRLEDMFILEAKNKMLSNTHTIQRHARKYHSYFFVFRKVKKYTRKSEKTL